jgi:hypothetical protein
MTKIKITNAKNIIFDRPKDATIITYDEKTFFSIWAYRFLFLLADLIDIVCISLRVLSYLHVPEK